MARLFRKGIKALFIFFSVFFIVRMMFGLVRGNFDWSLVDTIHLFESSFSGLPRAFTEYYASQFANISSGDFLQVLRGIGGVIIGVPYFIFVFIGDLSTFIGGLLGEVKL